MSDMRISDVLWKAANEHLSVDGSCPRNELLRHPGPWEYSCDAAQSAALCMGGTYDLDVLPARHFLESFGVARNSVCEFDEFEEGPDRQGARYAWLMFAHDIALEQGL